MELCEIDHISQDIQEKTIMNMFVNAYPSLEELNLTLKKMQLYQATDGISYSLKKINKALVAVI